LGKHFQEKYGGRATIPATELHNERLRLEKKHGEKIILRTFDDMTTDEERMDKMEYDVLTTLLQEASPEIKKADEDYVKAINQQQLYNSAFELIKQTFWYVLGLLVLLAVIKYLLS
jgi:hypothetical protein